ncbi:condensation domain-containing protein [Plantactinospora sonchi]|uniref:Condensation domain-containing protein n=1 Tax=Plantactinospora sonchi TaxID=1544735 RepID=A0ABU7RYR9_9ACTN
MGIRPIDLVPPPDDAPPAVKLTPVDRLPVRFTGDRDGTGPTTLGQANMLNWIAKEKPYGRFAAGPLELPPGATLTDVVAAVEVLLARHEALRTLFPADGRTQRVLRSGELAVDVFTADEEADPQVLVNELIRILRGEEFDLTVMLPVRVAVTVAEGVPTAAAVVYSHVVVDLPSMVMLGRQFTELAADPARRQVGPRGHQPLDQAAAERSDRGRRRAEEALRYWERLFATMPQNLYAVPPAPDGPGGSSSSWLWSRAAALALPHIAARTGASTSMAVLAAVCAVLSQRTGHRLIVMPTLCSNRYERRLRDFVGPLATDSLVSVEVTCDGFDDLVRRAGTAVLRANRYPAGSPEQMKRLEARVNDERGTHYARHCTFNDSSAAVGPDHQQAGPTEADPTEARRAMAETTVVPRPWGEILALLAFRLLEKQGQLILGVLTADRHRITDAESELLLMAVERLLVEAAVGDVALDRLGEVTGLRPLPRGADWRLVGSSWVQLSEVQRLLDDALPGSAGRVFAVPDERGDPQLVAYLAGGRPSTPRQAHLACLARLPGRDTAMTPQRYVLCARAPEDPTDLSAWQRAEVRHAGDGRAEVRQAGDGREGARR